LAKEGFAFGWVSLFCQGYSGLTLALKLQRRRTADEVHKIFKKGWLFKLKVKSRKYFLMVISDTIS
jgi:hypothetical protein